MKDSYTHIHPTSIGRYSASLLPEIRKWKFGEEFKKHLLKYGYRTPQLPLTQRIELKFKMLKSNLAREVYRRQAG